MGIIINDSFANSERRREPRFTIFMETKISREAKSAQSFSATSKNISLHGLQCICPEPTEPEEIVWLTIHPPVSNDSFTSKGVVKWCREGYGNYISGINLLYENQVQLTLQDIEKTLVGQIKLSNNTNDIKSKDKFINKNQFLFYKDIYWGVFLFLFKDFCLKNSNKLINELDLSLFYLEKLLKNNNSSNEFDTALKQISRISKTLNNSHNFLTHISNIMKLASEDYSQKENHKIYSTIHFVSLIRERIIHTKKIIRPFLKLQNKKIDYNLSENTTLLGHCDKVLKGLDVLLLHSIQFLIFGNAQRVYVHTEKLSEHFSLTLINDGTKMLKQAHLTILPKQSNTWETDSHREHIQIGLLQLAADLFSELQGTIEVHSESGNNSICLRIPRAESFKNTTAVNEIEE